ncbi:MAG: hypothetical protein LAT57_01410 [Balneolales bacterium]|nr:hypothetical protein [Balneolales bacterium]
MKTLKNLSLAVVVILGSAAITLAQEVKLPNYHAEPMFGTVDLTSGFTPDPHTIEVEAGGDTAMPVTGCVGFINYDAPDVDLNFTAGDYLLSFLAQSQAVDVSILIYTPDERWVCASSNIPGGAGILFNKPLSGNYNIWVGSPTVETYPNAVLSITENDEWDGVMRID